MLSRSFLRNVRIVTSFSTTILVYELITNHPAVKFIVVHFSFVQKYFSKLNSGRPFISSSLLLFFGHGLFFPSKHVSHRESTYSLAINRRDGDSIYRWKGGKKNIYTTNLCAIQGHGRTTRTWVFFSTILTSMTHLAIRGTNIIFYIVDIKLYKFSE